MKIEKRAGSPAEVSADADGIKVSGYAAVFNQDANIGGMFLERIAPGAFSAALERQDDVVFLINHDGLPLARTRSGTLELREDEKGLHITTTLDPDDPDVRSIVPKMQRGDLDKMSFAFVPDMQSWDESGDLPVRTIDSVKLYDVSIVTTPAYSGTDIGLRSLQDYQQNCLAVRNIRKRLQLKNALLRKSAAFPATNIQN